MKFENYLGPSIIFSVAIPSVTLLRSLLSVCSDSVFFSALSISSISDLLLLLSVCSKTISSTTVSVCSDSVVLPVVVLKSLFSSSSPSSFFTASMLVSDSFMPASVLFSSDLIVLLQSDKPGYSHVSLALICELELEL